MGVVSALSIRKIIGMLDRKMRTIMFINKTILNSYELFNMQLGFMASTLFRFERFCILHGENTVLPADVIELRHMG
jgi:hypothetical protein